MTDLATKADVAAGWRPLSTEEQTVADTLCGRASAEIRMTVAGVDARVAADPNYAIVVSGVVADAVKRVLVNPECRREDGVDDARWVLDQAVSTGALYITDTEYVKLRRQTVPQAGTPAYVISLGG